MIDRAEDFVTKLNESFNKNLALVEYEFNTEYGWPEFDPLRDEISKCLICNLCQAAITLTNHLIENFFKTILIYDESITNRDKSEKLNLLMYRPGVEKYNGFDLAQSLNAAKRKGLINKDQWKILDQFRNDFRNAYSHADKLKIFKDLTIPTNILQLDGETIRVSEKQDILLIDLIAGQGFAQVELSRQLAFEYFSTVDKIIRDVLEKYIDKNTPFRQ